MGDIQFYNEIMTVLTLQRKDISSRDFPNLYTWYRKIGNIPEVLEADRKFKEIVIKYNFIWEGKDELQWMRAGSYNLL